MVATVLKLCGVTLAMSVEHEARALSSALGAL